MISNSFGIQGEFAKLQKKTYKKLAKAITPLRAAQFTMFESYIENAIRMEILDTVPLIGEFDVK
jgi:hypothetical protein